MRVLRYIVRFLGISFIILWLLASFVRADDNVTVNFPDQMSVSGSVEITNLGINGDPVFEYSEPVQPNADEAVRFINDTPSISHSFISSYNTVSFCSVTPYHSTAGSTQLFNVKVPVFNWSAVKESFRTAFYGSKIGSNLSSPTNNRVLPGVTGGPSNLHFGTESYGHTIVTDQFGNGDWSFDFDWRFFTNSLPASGSGYIVNWDISPVKTALTAIISLLLWYEITYSIFGIIARG